MLYVRFLRLIIGEAIELSRSAVVRTAIVTADLGSSLHGVSRSLHISVQGTTILIKMPTIQNSTTRI